MGREKEFKFQASPEILSSLQQTTDLFGIPLSSTETQLQRDDYYDSAVTFRALRRGASLRTRTKKGVLEVTFKSGQKSDDVFDREEETVQTDSEEWANALVERANLAPLTLAQKVMGKVPITHMLTVLNTRTTMLFGSDGGQIELALDRIEFSRDNFVKPGFEVEIESKGLDDETFFQLGRDFMKLWGLIPSSYSKYQRGMMAFGETPDIPRLNLEAGLAQAAKMALDIQGYLDTPEIINIAGPSGSGKTEKGAKWLKEILMAGLVSGDGYYKPEEYILTELDGNFDDPDGVDLDKLAADILKFRQGQTVVVPINLFAAGKTSEVVTPSDAVIIESIFALHEKLYRLGHLNVYIDNDVHGGLLRRMLRDGGSKGRTGQSYQAVLRQFFDTVVPMYTQHVLPTSGNADLIISNQYNPLLEAARTGKQQWQRKYQEVVSPEDILAVGAIPLGVIDQVDTYYRPNNHTLSPAERLRVRYQGDRITLTYKMGGVESRLDVPISIDDIARIQTEYVPYIDVRKTRDLYLLRGGIVALDDVITPNLGKFIELQADSTDLLDEIGRWLNIRIDPIKGSYQSLAEEQKV